MNLQAAYARASEDRMRLRHLGDYLIAGRNFSRCNDPIAGGVFREMRAEAYRLACARYALAPQGAR